MTLFGFTTVFLIASIFIKIEAFPAFPCSSSSDSGYYADPTDCRYFYQCSWGNAAHFKCPANLYYNPSSQVCDYPENVACGAKPADSTTTTASPIGPKGIFVCPPDAGPFDHYSDPTDCGHFYQCVAGNAYRMPCPAGLHFNVAIQRCDYPENVHCVISPITTASPNACKDLQFTATADNELWIYADGQQIGYHFNWPTTTTVTIPETTKVIAAKINDYDNVVGGFLGSFSDGSVTDSSWKCTRNYSDEWKLSTFDDSAWPAAVATRGQGDRTWGTQPQIANNAKWIWAGSYETVNPTVTVYCRKRLACA